MGEDDVGLAGGTNPDHDRELSRRRCYYYKYAVVHLEHHE